MTALRSDIDRIGVPLAGRLYDLSASLLAAHGPAAEPWSRSLCALACDFYALTPAELLAILDAKVEAFDAAVKARSQRPAPPARRAIPFRVIDGGRDARHS